MMVTLESPLTLGTAATYLLNEQATDFNH